MANEIEIAVDVATSYWTVANIITAFGVLQVYGFLYALGEKESLLGYVRRGWWVILFILVVGTIMYGFLIHTCYLAEKGLLENQPTLFYILEASKLAYIARQLIILAMLGLVLITLFTDRFIHSDKYL